MLLCSLNNKSIIIMQLLNITVLGFDFWNSLRDASPFGVTLIFALPTAVILAGICHLFRFSPKPNALDVLTASLAYGIISSVAVTVGLPLLAFVSEILTLLLAVPHVSYSGNEGTVVMFFVVTGTICGVASAIGGCLTPWTNTTSGN